MPWPPFTNAPSKERVGESPRNVPRWPPFIPLLLGAIIAGQSGRTDLRGEANASGTPNQDPQALVQRIYDVRDILCVNCPSGIPRLLGENDDARALCDPDEEEWLEGSELAQFIQETIAPDSWASEDDARDGHIVRAGMIQFQRGKLLVVQTPQVHRQIEAFLRKLREFRGGVQVHLAGRAILASENFVRSVGLDCLFIRPAVLGPGGRYYASYTGASPPRRRRDGEPPTVSDIGTAFPDPGTPGIGTAIGIHTALGELTDSMARGFLEVVDASGDAARTVLSTQITCFNGQRARLRLGWCASGPGPDGPLPGGTDRASWIKEPQTDVPMEVPDLLVRPTVSSNRRYVTLDLQPAPSPTARPMRTLALTLGFMDGDAMGGHGEPIVGTVDVPESQVTFSHTTVSVPDSGTLLIAMALSEGKRGKWRSDLPSHLGRAHRGLATQRSEDDKYRYLFLVIRAQVLIRDEPEPSVD